MKEVMSVFGMGFLTLDLSRLQGGSLKWPNKFGMLICQYMRNIMVNCMAFKSIVVQTHYCLNFLPEKEHDGSKPNMR